MKHLKLLVVPLLLVAITVWAAVLFEDEPIGFLGKVYMGPAVTDATVSGQSEKLKVTGATLLNGTVDNPTYSEAFGEGDAKGLATMQLDGTVTDLATGVVNVAYIGKHRLVYASVGAGQTLDVDMDAGGLDVGGDQTDDEGYELVGGVLGASGRPFVIGTDPAFKFCATVVITDVSGTDDFHIGFRRAEIINQTFDNYLDLATIGNMSGDIKLETIDDNAATTTTDTTDNWADAASKVLCVLVSSAGVVTYTINGAAPTSTAAFTFDDGDPVVPFIHFINSADLADAITIDNWDVAYQ